MTAAREPVDILVHSKASIKTPLVGSQVTVGVLCVELRQVPVIAPLILPSSVFTLVDSGFF